jgi:hypothetical protein
MKSGVVEKKSWNGNLMNILFSHRLETMANLPRETNYKSSGNHRCVNKSYRSIGRS